MKAGDWTKKKECIVQTRGLGGAAVGSSGTDNIMFMFVGRRAPTHARGEDGNPTLKKTRTGI